MVAEPTLADDKARLSRLAVALEALAGDEWGLEAHSDGMRVTTRRTDGTVAVVGIVHAQATADEMELFVSALDTALMLFRMRSRVAAEFRQLRQQEGYSAPKLREGDFAANAGVTLKERAFWRFLETKGGGPVRDALVADAALKKRLGIQSKTQLNTDFLAQSSWIELRADYRAWLQGGG